MQGRVFFIFSLFLCGAVVTDSSEASLGLSSIFEKFLNVTNLIGGMPPILQNIAADIVDDIRILIPEAEHLLDKYNITGEILSELGKYLNMTHFSEVLLPELDELMKSSNLTEIIDEICGYLNVSYINEKLMPEVEDFLLSNNISQIFSEIKVFLNVSRIADELLPYVKDFVESNNVQESIREVKKFLNIGDVKGHLIPTLEKIFKNNDSKDAIRLVKSLLNITHISNELLPELEKELNGSEIHDIIDRIKKLTMNVTGVVGELLDELEKMLNESNIKQDVPDLKPFLDIGMIRQKLPEIQNILNNLTIPEIVSEIERLLNVSYLRERLPMLEDIMEDLGITTLLSEMKSLLEVREIAEESSKLEEMLEDLGVKSMTTDLGKLMRLKEVEDQISAIWKLVEKSNLTHLILDIERLVNTTYIRSKIVPEIERLWELSNVTEMIEKFEKLLNASFLRSDVVPEIEEFLYKHNVTDRLKAFIKLFNDTKYIEEILEKLDKQLNITQKGERISKGEFAEVVNGILDEMFEEDPTAQPITSSGSTQPTTSSGSTQPTTSSGSTQPTSPDVASTLPPVVQTTLPPVCDTDCQNVLCGTAILNSCGVCVGGTTNRTANEGKDCNNVCNGTARNDSCNACTNPLENDPSGSPKADCYGTCFGSATIDSCGNCSGGLTNKALDFWKDACDLCGGDNSTCTGCDGVPNSGKVNDSCSVCAGDGSSCTTISMVVPSLLPTASDASRVVDVYGAGLDGEAIKCLFGGVESAGTKVNRTYCRCTIPSGTAGDKIFTVKVVKNGNAVSTRDLTITLYDATVTKITALNPSEMFTNKTTEVTFGVSGIIESSMAVCIFSGTKIKAVFKDPNYKCTLPKFAISRAITLALSLNGVHELASDVVLARTVFARAPSMTKAQFTDTGALVEVEFDKNIDTTLLDSCADIFDTASVNLLGTSPDCSWSDGRHLTITPGTGVTIVGNSNLGLKANAVKSGGETYSKYASGSVSVTGASNPAQPISVIIGPSQISSCGHLSLDGSRSSGGGGRALKYKWSLVSPSDVPITAVLNLAMDKTKLVINGTLMSSGVTYKFKLEVQNFLSQAWKESTVDVTKANDPLPEVTVDGPLDGKVVSANSFFITAIAKAASCSSKKALTYTWTVACTNDDLSGPAKTRAESSSGFQKTSSKSAVKIDARSLVGGKTYEFTAVVALKASPATATTVKTTIDVAWSPLEAAIRGGDRTLGRDSGSLVLDAASSTVDPDNAPGTLSCSWICTDISNKQPCYSAVNVQKKIVLPDLCSVTVASTEFTADKSYQITSQVSKGSRTATSSIVVAVVAGKPPAVTVLTPSVKVVGSQKVALQGVYKSNISPTRVEWICAQEQNYRYIDLSNNALVSLPLHTYNQNGQSFFAQVLKENVLTPGASYKFILNVDDGTKVGSSNMIVEVRSGPTSGTFQVSPTTLQQLETITLSVSHWVTDYDAYPLRYEFGFVDNSGIFQPWVTQTSDEYTIPAPPGYGASNKLTLRMQVKDKFKSMKWMEKKITVTPATSIDEGQINDIIKDSIQDAKDTGDYSRAVPNMMNILQAISRSSNVPVNLAKTVTNSTVNTLLLALDSTLLDEERATPILKTFLEVNADYIEQPDDVLGGFKEVVEASGKNLDSQTIEKTLKWVGDVSSKANLSDAAVLKDVTAVDSSLASSLGDNVEFGQPAIETSADNSRVVIKVAYTALGASIETKTSPDATAVEFGDEMSDKYGVWECAPGKECMGVKVKMINYKEDYYSSLSSTKPNILTDKIVSIALENPETGEDLSVSGLGEPIKISFKTGPPSEGKTLVCYYYNKTEQKWSSDGMNWTLESGTLKVTANHLTSFTPAEQDGSVAPSDKTYQVSFVLSNTSWNNNYLDLNHAASVALKTKILKELNEVYKGDATMKSLQFEKFEKSGNNVKVVVKMTFSSTNTNPSNKLKLSLADGKLGNLAVDANSLDWVEAYTKPSDGDDDKTGLIIGIIVGASVFACIVSFLIAWLVYNSKKKAKVRSAVMIEEYDNQGLDNYEMAKVA